MHASFIRRIATSVATATLLFALTVASVAAHSQTVDPNGNGQGFTKPISNAWAQAHCNARSPEVLATTAEHAANSFSPPGALPCPLVPNPGGQIHGD